MTWLLFVVVATVIVVAGVQLARYGDVIGEKSGLGRSWIGVILLAATTSLPELFTGFGATALTPVPDIAVGDVLGSCMFNLLILSLMDAIQPERISARAHQGHALAIGLGLVLIALAGLGLAGGRYWPEVGWVALYSPLLIVLYFVAMRVLFIHERRRRSSDSLLETANPANVHVTLRSALVRYGVAAVFVVGAALTLPALGASLARETGLGEAFVGSLFIALTTSLPEIVVSIAAVRMGALHLGIGNVLGSNLFNLLILGLDDVFYTKGPLLSVVDSSHLISVLAVVLMNALFLIGLTQQVLTKRFRVAWDTGAIAVVYAGAVWLAFLMRS
ncbi:MAG: sodium:calcium antiporter [Vicinamibacterales bacterium]